MKPILRDGNAKTSLQFTMRKVVRVRTRGVGKETDEKGKGGGGGIKRKRGEINKDANHAEELRK